MRHLPPPLFTTQPKVLFFPFGLLSHYLRCLQLAESLRDDYAIFFRHDDRYAVHVQQRGHPTFPAAELPADQVMAAVRRFRFDWLEEEALEQIYLSQVNILRQLRPAFVVGDMSHTLRMATETVGIPLISIVNGYMSKYYANQRPLSKEHPVWRTGLPPRLLERLAPLGERLVMRHIHQPFRRLRQRYGLSIKQTYRDELEGDLTCICDSPLLFPQHRLPTHYRVIGPLFHVGPEPEIALLHRLYAHKPTIVLTMGSTGALAPFRLLARPEFADFNIVVAGEAEKDFQAPHVTALPFVNLAAVLPHADLVICHGGNGTVNQALAQGVPVLCSPTFFEQEWNAQRVAQLGLGACIDPPKDVGMFKRLLLHWIAQKGQPRFVDVATHLQVADSLARFREAVEEKWMVADKG